MLTVFDAWVMFYEFQLDDHNRFLRIGHVHFLGLYPEERKQLADWTANKLQKTGVEYYHDGRNKNRVYLGCLEDITAGLGLVLQDNQDGAGKDTNRVLIHLDQQGPSPLIPSSYFQYK